ncbi:MAG: zinc ribbon domain-containing protein [Gemmatimonadetes bacterium]|nr:zinc ribbon domain-containing protein [Gemmatimonadota bacterium]
MPTYEYRCPKGHSFDVFQKMSDPPGAKCPECGKPGERMIVPGAGFLFKGEGFYITDSRSDDYKKKAAGDKPEVASPGKHESSDKGPSESSAAKEHKSENPAKGEGGSSEKKESKKGKRSSGGTE